MVESIVSYAHKGARKLFGMELQKAKIIVLDGNDQEDRTITVLFNPSKYSLRKSSNYSVFTGTVVSRQSTEYNTTTEQYLDFELFFDTYESGEDVREKTEQIEELMKPVDGAEAPPKIRFVWGSLNFRCYLVSLTQDFTLFRYDGRPLRAILHVSLMTVPPDKPAGHKSQLNANSNKTPTAKVAAVQDGDSLWGIAAREYHDPNKWKIIADHNGISDPKSLVSGTRILIPSQ